MPDWDKYNTKDTARQGLTYKRQRGCWHWRCQVCGQSGQERIPDKAQDHYQHNPGNPALVICGRCTGYRFDPARVALTLDDKRNGKHKNGKNGKPIKDSQDCDPDSELSAPWGDYMAIARRFERKAIYQDREDLRHDIVLALAEVAKNNGHKPYSQALLYRIASHTVTRYWRKQYAHTNGVNCHNCAKDQRQECKDSDLYSNCPKAIRIESLSKPITDEDGNVTELGQLIADDKAIDVLDWIEADTWQLGYPQRLVNIANKIQRGEALSDKDRQYLSRYRRKAQGKLF
ncbi:hypothetical protein M1N92_00870 [Dehalococcoidia bacterium]|nr:hypothetical protein [Dehalococcoidia bacterium]